VKIGVVVPAAAEDGGTLAPTWEKIRAFALAAEAHGLDSVWVFDHFFHKPKDGPIQGQHEAWTVVSALAAVTERVQIGTIVMCASFRNPSLLAKMAAAVDEVSDGRLILGLGAGWHDPEYEAFGFPTDHRVARLEEQIQIIGPLLHGETVSFAGTYHRARDAVLVPAPGHRIPVLVAAFGDRMLRLTARHADAWNTAWYGAPDERLARELARFDEALAAEGRDPAAVERTVGMVVESPEAEASDDADSEDSAFRGSVEELAAAIDAHEALGIGHLIVLLQPLTPASLNRFAEALALRDRVSGG
jgi:probable F420-dependent oxidoreductase